MLLLGMAIVAILVLLEWRFNFDFSLGILYVFPVMIADELFRDTAANPALGNRRNHPRHKEPVGPG